MMIDRIGSIDPIQSGKKPERTDAVHSKAEKDSIAVSSEAVEKGDLFQAIELVSTVSDVRADKVAALKQKIQDPNYINNVMVESAADRIMDLFGL